METGAKDEVRFKKEQVARYYGRLAPTFDRTGPRLFSRDGQRLVELAQLSPGARVLDVAAGRGALLFPAAERVGPSGQVIGIDLTPQMVQETSAEIARLGLKNAEMRQMDAEELDFPDVAFDWVLCGYGLFFFPRLQRALAQFHRVLKPGGQFAATTDGQRDKRWNWFYDLLSAYGADVRVASQDLEDPGELVAALSQAGFGEVEMVEEEYDVVYASEEEWWTSRRADLELRMQPEVLARFKAEAFERLQSLKAPDGIHRVSRVRFHLASKPLW